MATAQIDTVIRHLRRAVLRQEAAGRTDGQLLASFIEQQDEAAFDALVHRHGLMVFGVCRRVIGNHHDAEDAFQATCLVLARKASSVRPRERVANWLHGVALRTALKAKALTAKRRGREKQLTQILEPEATPQDPRHDLQPLLDQELNGLPEKYRLPIVLCDLEDKTIKEAAQQLGWPQGTLAGRLARGRKLLAKRLASRGVVLSAGPLAAVVSQNAVSAAVPTSLMSSTVKAAMIAARQATVAGVAPAKVAALMEGVMKAMLITKLKTVTAVLLVLTAVGIAGGLLSRSTRAAAQTAAERLPRAAGKQRADQQPHLVPFVESGPHLVPFVESGTVGSSPAPAEAKADGPRHDAAKSDLDRLQGVWSVVSVEQGGKPSKLDKAVFMVDGKRACWQTSDFEMQGGLYLEPTRKPKSYDLAMSTKTMEGIYALEGDTLRLCYDLGSEPKRPGGFTTEKGSWQVLMVLKRTYGPEVFPFRLADGTRAFPTVIEKKAKSPPPIEAKTPPPIEKAKTPPPQTAPQPRDRNPRYDFGFPAPRSEELPAAKDRQPDFPVKATEGERVTVQALAPDMHTRVKEEPTGKLLFGASLKLKGEDKNFKEHGER